MPDQRSVMKEFRALDQRRRAGPLTPDEEARHARLLELIGPESGAGGLGGGFDVNAAAERLRESLLPAGLRNRPPPPPEVAPEPEPEPLALDAPLDFGFAAPAELSAPPVEALADEAQAAAWFDPASLGAAAAVEGWDPNAAAEQGWDPAQGAAAVDPAAYGEALGEASPAEGDPGAFAYDPAQPFDPASLAFDAEPAPAPPYDPSGFVQTATVIDPNVDPAMYEDPTSFTQGSPAAHIDASTLQAYGLAGGTVIDPNVDPAQTYEPSAFGADPALGWDGAPAEGVPEEGVAADAAAWDPAAALAAAFDPAQELAPADDASAFDPGADPATAEFAAAYDPGQDPALAAAAAFALPEEGAAADAAAWDPAFASADANAQGAADPGGWMPADAGADPGASTGLAEELDAAAGATPLIGDPEPVDPSLEPTETHALAGEYAAPADGTLPPAGWDATPPEAGEAAAAEAPRGDYDEDARAAAFSLPDTGGAEVAGLENLLPFDAATETAIPAGATPFGFETLGEYDDTAGFGGAAPGQPPAAAAPFEDGDAAAAVGASDAQADAALDQGFAQESTGSFGAADAPGWATGAEPLPWHAPATAPAPDSAAPAPTEDLDTIDGAEILEEISIDDAAFAAPALDFEPPAAAPAPSAPAPVPVAAKPVVPVVAAAPRAAPAPVFPAPVPASPVVAAPKPLAAPAPQPAPVKPAVAAPPAPAAAKPAIVAPAAAAARPAAVPPPAPPRPPARPAPAATRVAGAQRVVVHTVEGQVKRGVLEDADLAAAALALAPQPGAATESLAVDKVKAIFFMLAPGEAAPSPEGKRVRVTFKDGRQVAGFSPDYREDGVGFFMVPADTRTNTGRIWVYRSAVKNVAVS